MTRKKQRISAAKWIASITAALIFGAFWGSPAPELLKDRIPEAAPTFSKIIRQAENLHNSSLYGAPEDMNQAANQAADNESKTASEFKTAAVKDTNIGTAGSTSSGISATDAGITATGAGISATSPSISAAYSDIEATSSGIDLIVSAPSAEVPPDYICLNANRGGVADRKEKDVLVHLINAEAYGLSYKAKVAVGQVVMNRWTGPYYGDDLLAIMTAPHQFTPIYNGSAYEKEVEPDSVKAADAVLKGAGVDELTADTYYFVNPDFTQDKTIEKKMVFVCEIEGIHFYKPPVK